MSTAGSYEASAERESAPRETGYEPESMEAWMALLGPSEKTDAWLAGYRWALEHLTDPGVLRDAAQYVEERGSRPNASPEVPLSASVENSDDGLSTRSAPHRAARSGATDHPFADWPLLPGQRIRVTFEADVLTVGAASANRGISIVRTRAGAGMSDGIWLVREPGCGEILDVQIVREGVSSAASPNSTEAVVDDRS